MIFFIKNILTPIFILIFKTTIYISFVGFIFCLIRKIFKNKINNNFIIVLWILFIRLIILFPFFENNFYVILYFNKYEILPNIFAHETDFNLNEFGNDIKYQIPEIEFFNIISIIYFIFLIYKIIKIYFIFKINKKEICINQNCNIEYEVLYKLKEKLNINKNIKLIKMENIKTPMIIGIFRIKIFIPKQTNLENLNCFLIHELCHYKRKDNILKFIIEFIKLINYFNPLINIILNNLENDIEIQTDKLAIKYMELETKKKYCYLLLGE